MRTRGPRWTFLPPDCGVFTFTAGSACRAARSKLLRVFPPRSTDTWYAAPVPPPQAAIRIVASRRTGNARSRNTSVR